MKHVDQKILWEFISGDLETKNIEFIKQHLEECHKCKDEYDFQFELHNDLYNVNNEEPSLEFSDSVTRKIDRIIGVEKANKFWFKFTKIAIVSAILVAISLPLIMISLNRIELHINSNYSNKLILPLICVCVILWSFYAIEVFYNRAYRK